MTAYIAAHQAGTIVTAGLPLEWRQVDFGAGEIRLDAGTTKNRRHRALRII